MPAVRLQLLLVRMASGSMRRAARAGAAAHEIAHCILEGSSNDRHWACRRRRGGPRSDTGLVRYVEPTFYSWFLHREMLDGLLASQSRWRQTRLAGRSRIQGNLQAYTSAFQDWLAHHEVPALQALLVRSEDPTGRLVWVEEEFHWSDAAGERVAARAGASDIRSTFHTRMTVGGERYVRVSGTFNPLRMTSSTSGVELRGVRSQYLFGQVGSADADNVEIRPVVIGTRLLAPTSFGWDNQAWQCVSPRRVDQFASTDWETPVSDVHLLALRAVSERRVKEAFAAILGEPVVPNDWGGEQFDLWTTRMRVDGEAVTAAFVLKGPAKFAPMTIGMLGKNGDQLERLAHSAAQVLVVQHCHVIRPEVVSLLRSLASDYRDVRRYMVIDGFDTFRLLRTHGYLPAAGR